MTYYVSTFTTRTGPFSLACNAAGDLVAAAFGPATALRRYLGPAHLAPDARRTRAARTQVREYFAGRRTEFRLPLAPAGTVFQQRVWRRLQRIQFGTTCSYGELARALHSSPRAVGGANAANPLCLLVPCHRVIGANGALVGFAYGAEIKRRLLAHENAAGFRGAPACDDDRHHREPANPRNNYQRKTRPLFPSNHR